MSSTLFDLTGRTALITGSTRGIGLALARGLGDAGATVIVNSRQQSAVDEAISALKGHGFDVRGSAFDVAVEASVLAAFEDFDRQGLTVDILINNAGIQHRAPMLELDLKDWQRVIDTNLTAAFLVGKQAAKRMIERGRGGKIINIGSLTSEAARATVAPYTVAKGGIKTLSRAMAAEWAKHDIQANSIGPGYILTDMNTALVNNPQFDAWVKSSNPAQRWGKPEGVGRCRCLPGGASVQLCQWPDHDVDGGWLSVLDPRRNQSSSTPVMSTLITDVKVILTAPEGINLVVVKVQTNQPGLIGYGCATFAYRHLAVKCLIEEYLRPLLIGRNAQAIEELWQLMHQNAYWRNGPIENNAISGIDMALWDIKGKLANMPLFQLFGGKCREGVPIYRHADGRDIAELCDNIQKYREQGITHIRCQSGGYGGAGFGTAPINAPEGASMGVYLDSRKYTRDTVKMFDEIRSRVGFDVELCHDVHERLKPIDAIRFACALEPFDLFFLEDAIALEDAERLRQLRAKTKSRGSGRAVSDPFEGVRLVIDFIRVHLSQIGGITPGRKLQLFAEQYGVRTAWHGAGDMSPLAHAADTPHRTWRHATSACRSGRAPSRRTS